jgi:uncharacterized oxidoreductase
MDIAGNTILITGGGSGIGKALAEAFHARGNQIVIAGRRQGALDATIAANPGMKSILLDIEDPASIRQVATTLRKDFPRLNVVIHNAGIMRPEHLTDGSTDIAEATVTTNLLGPIRLNAALIDHLMAQPKAAVVTVSSGLAFLPFALAPTYCATKAAIHSYSETLRYQLKDTSVQVHELVPPYVQTELMGERQKNDPNAMPLDAFIAEAMALFESTPDAKEILVERVKPLRFAEVNGSYPAFFKQFNDHAADNAP